MFTVACMDESTDSQKTVYGLGGCIADQRDWNRFESLWKPTQDELASRRVTFHMADLAGGFGEFSDRSKWPADERKRIITAMTDAVLEAELTCIHTAVELANFRALFPQDDERGMYYLCFISAIQLCAVTAKNWGTSCAFVFDQKREFEFMCHAMYRQCSDKSEQWIGSRRVLGTITFADQPDYPILQAADFIAYEGIRLCDPSRPIRKSMKRIGEGDCIGRLLGLDELSEVKDLMDKTGMRTVREFHECGLDNEIWHMQKTWKPKTAMMKA